MCTRCLLVGSLQLEASGHNADAPLGGDLSVVSSCSCRAGQRAVGDEAVTTSYQSRASVFAGG